MHAAHRARRVSPVPGRCRRWRARTRAEAALRAVARGLGWSEPHFRSVRWIGEGLSRGAFASAIDAAGETRVLVALVPLGDAPTVSLSADREARLIAYLASRELPFRVLAHAVTVGDGDDAILACEGVDGLPLDLRADRVAEFEELELDRRTTSRCTSRGCTELWPVPRTRPLSKRSDSACTTSSGR